MTRWTDEASDKVVIDPIELEPSGPAGSRVASGELTLTLARGTRERVVARPEDTETVPRRELDRRCREDQDAQHEHAQRGHGALERDPIAVLRAWPHSTGAPAVPPPRARGAPPSASRRRIHDKIVLAHLALDLFQEIDQLQAIVQRAHDTTPCDGAVCSDPRCAETVDVLRGALVEACLLVQRVAMMPQDERLDVEDRIHELLEVLHHTRHG